MCMCILHAYSLVYCLCMWSDNDALLPLSLTGTLSEAPAYSAALVVSVHESVICDPQSEPFMTELVLMPYNVILPVAILFLAVTPSLYML